jgi:hypothetical protein
MHDLIRDYVSPDGTLCFLVRAPEGDLTMGFDGCPSHTHGDILAVLGETGETPEEATKRYVNDLISSKLIIAVATVQGKIRDIWITDDPLDNFAILSTGRNHRVPTMGWNCLAATTA